MVAPITFGIITLVGVLGNAMVIFVILSHTIVQNILNLLLLNLALTDLIFLLVVPAFTAYRIVVNHWPFGDVICKLVVYIMNVTIYVIAYTLVLISAISYMTIIHRAATINIRTKQNVIISILSLWVIISVSNIPVILSYRSREEQLFTYDCIYTNEKEGQVIYTLLFVFSYVLPVFLICVFSVCILHHIRTQKTSMVGGRSQHHRYRARCLIMLIVVVYAVLWLPIHIHNMVTTFGHTPETKLYMVMSIVWTCTAFFNSAVNPFLYNLASNDFRQAFRKVMCSACVTCRSQRASNLDESTLQIDNA